MRWVKRYLYCCTPCTGVRVRAAHIWPLLLRFVPALPVYPTVRLGAALMLRFWWMVPFLPLLFCTASWRGCYIDASRSRGPYLVVGWHTDVTATCSRDTTTISASVASLRAAPIRPPSPSPPPSAALPTDNKQKHVYQSGSGLLGAG